MSCHDEGAAEQVVLPPLWEDLAFLSPMSGTRADALAAWVADGLVDGPVDGPVDAPAVLDVGCGWGELLLRVLERAPAATGTGTDLDAARVAEARRRAEARGLGERARFVTAHGAAPPPGALPVGPVDAVLVLGASQVWGADVGEGLPLDYAAALTAVRRLVRRGGRVLYAEAVWSAPPTPAAVAPLSGRTDEFLPLPALARLAVEHGFAVAGCAEADLGEWDAFESGFTARAARWLADHPREHPGAGEVAAGAARQRAAYLDGYRGVLGFAFLQLLAV